jgi:hypothetical protein
LERRLVQADAREDAAGSVDVERLAGVTGGREREELAVEVEPVAHHSRCLQGFVRRTRVDRRGHVADLERGRAVGVEGDERAAVAALDESGADDLSENDGISHGFEPTGA